MEELFRNISETQMKYIYNQIMKGREEGLRPRVLDDYIREVQKKYQMDFWEAWRSTEKLFWNEVGRRYFSDDRRCCD